MIMAKEMTTHFPMLLWKLLPVIQGNVQITEFFQNMQRLLIMGGQKRSEQKLYQNFVKTHGLWGIKTTIKLLKVLIERVLKMV